jgi:hypothetical protein
VDNRYNGSTETLRTGGGSGIPQNSTPTASKGTHVVGEGWCATTWGEGELSGAARCRDRQGSVCSVQCSVCDEWR